MANPADSYKLYMEVSHKLNQAKALCCSVGAASRTGTGDLPPETIDMSLNAVSDLLEQIDGQVHAMYQVLRADRSKEACHG